MHRHIWGAQGDMLINRAGIGFVSFTLCDGVVATRAPRPTNHRGTEVTMAQNIAIERVDHIGVRVRNLDRALGFYRVLGFAVVRRAEGDDVAIIRSEHGVELNLVFNANAGDPATNILMDVRDKYPGYTHKLKGFAEPVPVWRVLSARDVESRFAATRTGSSAPLVGRQEEMGLLLRAWEGSSHGRGQVVLIQGEAGFGKSRLVEGLREAAGKDHIWVAIRCSPFHTASAFHPIIEHLKRLFGWEPEDSAPQHLAKLEAGLGGFKTLPLAESVRLFADLMSVPVPEDRYPRLAMTAQQQRDATLDAIVAWLIELAERTPVLMAWEDLHWADPTTLETLGMLIEQPPTAAMLVVATYRPELTPPWPQRSHLTPITLNRLERPEVETMVGHLAGGRPLPGEVVDHIVAKADGVPLYVEELTKAILGSGVLAARGDAYVLTGALAQLNIPETLQDSLMARLDRAPQLDEVAQLG